MSDFDLNEITRHLREIQKSVPKRENETHQNETIYLDFAKWHNCLFENCRIIIEYGHFSLVKCDFINCGFESPTGSPAYAILSVNNLLKENKTK